MVRDGDCLMTFTYGLTGIAVAIRDIYAEARLLEAGPPAKLRAAGPAEAVAALADKAADLPTRFFATRILAQKPAPEAAAAVLLAMAGSEKENWLVRKNAVIALGVMKATAATPLLGNLLVNSKANLKHFATLALKQISTVIKPSFGDPRDETRPDPLAP
jgi:HEAT repeat protein